jgi:hypothetical protein
MGRLRYNGSIVSAKTTLPTAVVCFKRWTCPFAWSVWPHYGSGALGREHSVTVRLYQPPLIEKLEATIDWRSPARS